MTIETINFDCIPMESGWRMQLHQEFEKPYMLDLKQFLDKEFSSGKTIFPPKELIFNALNQTPYEEIKVVIMGQDPYHGIGQAEGLSFSVPKNIRPPPSLQNIFKELQSDLKVPKPSHGSLISWAKQGVLLLNATLTVREGQPKSHFGKGWETFTDKIIQSLCEKSDPIVFMLWGNSAIEKFKTAGFASSPHLVLTAPHPSPLSAYTGFFGCSHFSKANLFLKSHHKSEIHWELPIES